LRSTPPLLIRTTITTSSTTVTTTSSTTVTTTSSTTVTTSSTTVTTSSTTVTTSSTTVTPSSTTVTTSSPTVTTLRLARRNEASKVISKRYNTRKMKLTAGLSHLVLIVKVDRFLTRIHKCWYSLEFGFHSLHSLRKRKSHTSSHTFNFHVQHIPPMYHHTLVFSIITHFPLNDGQTSTVQPSTCQSTTNRKYPKSKFEM